MIEPTKITPELAITADLDGDPAHPVLLVTPAGDEGRAPYAIDLNGPQAVHLTNWLLDYIASRVKP